MELKKKPLWRVVWALLWLAEKVQAIAGPQWSGEDTTECGEALLARRPGPTVVDTSFAGVARHVEALVNHVAETQGVSPESLLSDMRTGPNAPTRFDELDGRQIAVVWTTLWMAYTQRVREFEGEPEWDAE